MTFSARIIPTGEGHGARAHANKGGTMEQTQLEGFYRTLVENAIMTARPDAFETIMLMPSEERYALLDRLGRAWDAALDREILHWAKSGAGSKPRDEGHPGHPAQEHEPTPTARPEDVTFSAGMAPAPDGASAPERAPEQDAMRRALENAVTYTRGYLGALKGFAPTEGQRQSAGEILENVDAALMAAAANARPDPKGPARA